LQWGQKFLLILGVLVSARKGLKASHSGAICPSVAQSLRHNGGVTSLRYGYEKKTVRTHRTWFDKLKMWQRAYETKISDERHEAIGRGATPEASRKPPKDNGSKRRPPAFASSWLASNRKGPKNPGAHDAAPERRFASKYLQAAYEPSAGIHYNTVSKDRYGGNREASAAIKKAL
jgi:hypothetical protein